MVIIASFTANIFSYLFQLVSGRYFSKEEYGVLVALFSLSGIIPLVAQFFVSGIPKIVAEIKDVDYPNRISSLFYAIFKINTFITLGTLVLMFLFKDNIADFLNITDKSVLVPFTFAVAAGTFTLFFIPFIQGLTRFKAYSFVTLLTAIAKLSVAIVVLYLGLAVKDIFWGLTFTTLGIGIICYKILLKNINLNWRLTDREDIDILIKYSLGGALSLIGLNLLNLTDVILVKHFFSPEMAGVYGSISVIGRIVFYAASPVAIVMLPICTEKFKKGEDFIKPFLSALAISGTICITAAFFYSEFPHFVITTLFGSSYLSAEPYLGLFAFFMLGYTFIFIFSTFFIAISKFFLSSLVIISAIVQAAGIYFFWHENIYQVIYVSIFSVSLVLIAYLFAFFILLRKPSTA